MEDYTHSTSMVETIAITRFISRVHNCLINEFAKQGMESSYVSSYAKTNLHSSTEVEKDDKMRHEV